MQDIGGVNGHQSEQVRANARRVVVFDRRQKFFSLLFIVAYFSISIIALLPESPLALRLQRLIRPVSRLLQLDQNWKLFGPDLRIINFYSEAIVTFEDGSTKLYTFPRLEKMSVAERVMRQKLCKLLQDCMPWPDFQRFSPSVARYIARSNMTPGNQPVLVSLSYNWEYVPPMKKYLKQKDLPEPSHRFTFLIYEVEPEDLK